MVPRLRGLAAAVLALSSLAMPFAAAAQGGSPAASRVILAIGDSNGASEHGWVNQLRRLRPEYAIINKSVSGNTIGFDNLGREQLNTLKNLDRYLHEADRAAGPRGIDHVLIGLGTNDSKAVFDGRQGEVVEHLRRLVERIRGFAFSGGAPRITIVSPPPYGPDSLMKPKYEGGDARVRALVPRFEAVAEEKGCGFVDVYHPLKPHFAELAPDGVHMRAEGQRRIAQRIADHLPPTSDSSSSSAASP